MKMKRLSFAPAILASAVVTVGLGLGPACGGASPPTSTAAAPAAPVVEEFGPGLVLHRTSKEALTADASRVLAASYTLEPADGTGLLTTAWATHDAERWPGAETRVLVELTDDRVIVRIQCRHQRGTCARTQPPEVALVELSQRLAEQIGGALDADRVLAVMREFKDAVCACTVPSCLTATEKKMMEWAMENMEAFKDIKPTRAQDETADRIQDEMDACRERVAGEPDPSPGAPIDLVPAPPGGTGSKACDRYLETFDLVVARCRQQLGPALDAMLQARNAQVEAFAQWSSLDKASRKAAIEAAETGCKAANDALRQSATSMGCTL